MGKRVNKKRRKRPIGLSVARWLLGVVCVFAVLVLVGGLFLYLFVWRGIDAAEDEALFQMAGCNTVTRLYRDGEGGDTVAGLSGYRALEMESEALSGGEMCSKVSLSEIPLALQNAFIAIEDRRFYEHDGVDWLRTGRAVVNHLFHFESRFGGSTITQQLVKNIGGENEVSVFRKMREILRALRLEKAHTKEEILEAYLNAVPFGNGCVGVGMAARMYYGKEPSELSLAECAALSAIPNSPARFDPYRHPEANRARRDLILSEMEKQGYLTEGEALDAKEEDTAVPSLHIEKERVLSWYTETVISDVIEGLCEKGYDREGAERLLYHGGLSVYTACNEEVQRTLEEYFADLSHFSPEAKTGLEYAMTVVDVDTGRLLGTVGGVGRKTANRILDLSRTRRPPGSALKPLALYAPAIEMGKITPGTVFDDVPVSFGSDAAHPVPWPRNSPGVYQGLITAEDALAYSKNTVAVRLYRELGRETVYRYLARELEFGGIVRRAQSADGRGLTDLAVSPLALGQLTYGTEVREMTAAYAALAADGVFRRPLSYLLVTDRNGKVLLENKEEEKRVFSPETARLTTQMLSAVTERGTAKRLRLKQVVDVAGKTGTSGNTMDKWFVGYTPYLAAGIWCGYPEGGREIPKLSLDQIDVWDAVMRLLHKEALRDREREMRSFSTAGLVKKTVCRDSGCLPGAHCDEDPRGCRLVSLWFKRGTEPKAVCHRHVSVPYDFEVGGVITDLEEGEVPERVSLLDIPWRDFPIQVHVRDAEFVWRPLAGKEAGSWWGVPFFIHTVPRGRFVGLSDHGGGRQFNAAAYDRIPPSLRESDSESDRNEDGEDGSEGSLPLPGEESLLDGILTFSP